MTTPESGIIETGRTEIIDPTNGDWENAAACRNADPSIFFSERYNSTAPEAKEVCGRCAVRAQCLIVNLGEKFGVWGGSTESERKEIAKDFPRRIQDVNEVIAKLDNGGYYKRPPKPRQRRKKQTTYPPS